MGKLLLFSLSTCLLSPRGNKNGSSCLTSASSIPGTQLCNHQKPDASATAVLAKTEAACSSGLLALLFPHHCFARVLLLDAIWALSQCHIGYKGGWQLEFCFLEISPNIERLVEGQAATKFTGTLFI